MVVFFMSLLDFCVNLALITVSMSQYRSNLCLFPASGFPNTLTLKIYAEEISLCMMTRLMSSVLSFVTSSIKRNPTFFISFLSHYFGFLVVVSNLKENRLMHIYLPFDGMYRVYLPRVYCEPCLSTLNFTDFVF